MAGMKMAHWINWILFPRTGAHGIENEPRWSYYPVTLTGFTNPPMENELWLRDSSRRFTSSIGKPIGYNFKWILIFDNMLAKPIMAKAHTTDPATARSCEVSCL